MCIFETLGFIFGSTINSHPIRFLQVSFYISKHAEAQPERRRIPIERFNSVLQSPQQVIEQDDGTRIYQSQLLFENGKTYLLRVVVSERTQSAIVMTVYKTNQISRYWRLE